MFRCLVSWCSGGFGVLVFQVDDILEFQKGD